MECAIVATVAFVKKGAKWPNTAAEYPRHPDWLTVEEAAALLGVTRRVFLRQVYEFHTITPVLKKWRYGCWNRSALFINKYEVELLKLRRAAVKKPKLAGKPQQASPTIVNVNPLRQWRKEAGKSGAEVAAGLGVGEWMVAGWEHGRTDPGVDKMALLAKLMEVDLDDLKLRWAAWRILMLAPLPKEGRIPTKLSFNKADDIPDEVA